MRLVLIGFISLVLGACASSRLKERQQVREKAAAASGLYCEFVSGEEFPDVDVEMNLRMSKKCDGSKPVSIAPYRNSSNHNGMIYCCGYEKDQPRGTGSSKAPANNSKSEKGELDL